MTEAQRPQTRADVEALPYNDKQSLAADLGFGRIVGVKEQQLENYIADHVVEDEPADVVDEDVVDADQDDRDEDVVDADQDDRDEDVVDAGDEPDPPADPPADSADRATPSSDPENTEMSTSDTDDDSSEPPTDGQTDAISVGHEGQEKLSPTDAPDDGGTAVEPPEGLDEFADVRPEDLEADVEQRDRAVDGDQEDSEPASDPAPADQRETSGDAGETEEEDSSGGLLSRIKGDSSESEPEPERTSEEIVEDAPNEEARSRRREMKAKLEQTMGGAGDVDDDVQEESADASGDPSSSETSDTAPSTQKASGMLVDDNVVGHMIAMPFNMASNATGWDGWELSPQERQANAELFVAMCDERDIDVGPTTMFALSIGGTFSGKAMRYRRQKPSEDDAADVEERAGAVDDDVQEERPDRGAGDDRRDDRADQGERLAPTTSRGRGAGADVQEDSETDDVDPNDSSTW